MKLHLKPILLFLLLLLGYKTIAANEIDSLMKVLNTELDDTTRYNILTKLTYLSYQEDHKLSLVFGNKAIRLSDSTGIKPDVRLFDFLIYLNDNLGKYDVAIELLERKIKFLYPPNTTSERIQLKRAKAWLLYREGDYKAALDMFTEAIDLAKEKDLKKQISVLYYDKARVYERLNDPEKEKEFYNLYLSGVDHNKKAKYISWVYYRLGNIELEMNNYNEALVFYDRAFELSVSKKDSSDMIMILNHIAWIYYLKGELDISLEKYLENLEILSGPRKLNFECNIYGNIGNIYRDKKDYKSAIENYKKSISIAKKINDYFNLDWLYEDIALMYASLDNFEEAYKNSKLHSKYADSAMSDEYNLQLFEAQTRYEADKKFKEFELLSMKYKQNQYITYGLISVLSLVLIIGSLVFYQNKLLSKQRLAAMNHKVSELTQRNLRQQMNPHFIFNTLNSIQYYVFQNDRIASNNYMSKFAKLIRMTLENSRHMSIPIKDELEALKLYLELESLRFKGKFDWKITVDEEIDTLLYRIPTMLIQPFVENSIVHGLMHKESRGLVDIDLKLDENQIYCIIEDNGIGREKAMKIKEEKSKSHNSLGTTITESRLTLVNSLYGSNMKVKYTDLKDSNDKPSGTRVEIIIPVVG